MLTDLDVLTQCMAAPLRRGHHATLEAFRLLTLNESKGGSYTRKEGAVRFQVSNGLSLICSQVGRPILVATTGQEDQSQGGQQHRSRAGIPSGRTGRRGSAYRFADGMRRVLSKIFELFGVLTTSSMVVTLRVLDGLSGCVQGC